MEAWACARCPVQEEARWPTTFGEEIVVLTTPAATPDWSNRRMGSLRARQPHACSRSRVKFNSLNSSAIAPKTLMSISQEQGETTAYTSDCQKLRPDPRLPSPHHSTSRAQRQAGHHRLQIRGCRRCLGQESSARKGE